MNRTLTAAVALTAALGMAGIAHAQTDTNMNTSPSTSSSPMTTAPSAAQPGMTGTHQPATTSPSGQTGGSYGTSGTQSNGPQANAQSNEMQGQSASPAQVQQAQQQLKSHGLYRGAVDGINGPETQSAVIAFQRQQGLPQTAQLDEQTMNRLNGSGSGSSMGNEPTTGSPNMTASPPAGTQNPATQTPPATMPGGTTTTR